MDNFLKHEHLLQDVYFFQNQEHFPTPNFLCIYVYGFLELVNIIRATTSSYSLSAAPQTHHRL
jgi:hypothetical protein